MLVELSRMRRLLVGLIILGLVGLGATPGWAACATGIAHTFVSAQAASTNALLVGSTEWNDCHTITGGVGSLLTVGSGSGVVTLADVAVGQVLTSGGVGVIPAWSASPSLTALTVTTLTPTASTVTLSSGQLLLPDGTEAAPAAALTSDTATGLFRRTANVLTFSATGTAAAELQASGFFLLPSSGALTFTAGAISATSDLFVRRDAANTLALSNSTNAQTFNHYGSEITAGTRYSRLAIKHATTSVTAAVGATATATNLIVAKSNVLGCNTVVTTALGNSTGTTGYSVGDGTDADRWGTVVGIVAGTDTDQTDATANPTGWFTAANNVVLTATGGNFDGTGVILVDCAYTMTEAQ